MGAINKTNCIIRNLAKLCVPFLPFLSKDTKWEWKDEHDRDFEEIKNTILRITEIERFKWDEALRTVCDASKEGLRAVLH